MSKKAAQTKGFYIEYKLTAAPNAVLSMNIDSASKDGAKQKFYKHFGGSKNAQIIHINQHGEIDAREEEAIRAEAERIAAEAEAQEILSEPTQPEQPAQAPEVAPAEKYHEFTAKDELKACRHYTDFAAWYLKYRHQFRLFRKLDGEAVDTIEPYRSDGTVVVMKLSNGKVAAPFARVIHRYFELVEV